MRKYAVEIQGLYKRFGSQQVLDGIDLKVPEGSVLALLGPNGAGKTTLVNIMSTLVTPDAGTLLINGYDVSRERQKVQQSISLTGQFAAVDEVLTAEENLRMICRLSGLTGAEARIRSTELLAYFDLASARSKRAGTFSGGMKRRLDLAISLVVPKPVLFLDEPTTGLDTRSRRALWDMILQLKSQGITIVLTTQYLEEADQLADRIAVLDGGHIVAEGSPEELKSRVGGEVLELRNAEDEVIHRIPTSGSIGDVANTLQELMRQLPTETRVGIHRPNMDEVFIALTEKKMEEIV
ncbi:MULTISPECIES: ATP-binding cassette domain-containing protein [Paenibacillus]|uniref:Daunorubicin resistance ABC transporter ATPase subunit n=3 Tax=Bacilli TaxID=91061 RepID=G4H8U3_9BACL|nr:ATP-binding cassette domain-containing protein [Paenibacillus lactis]EHB68278.1 daunorubicin resistance ABC transporter ATPase subunit [Paenibacillus lactis 154]MBP1894230.1 ABC-2 type transport system ATP-binding protein [Paenibacillus lactis]GIO89416.1 daunorubicin resistance protein DrrA family ABC transporter ATP-binding protein [Paenibacillus lactis]HAF99592.1 ABC transporter ATP-binding protein [Paenibacillus lactis]